MTKTFALLLDSYRELNAKRLFWIALIINALAVLVCACAGVKDARLTVLFWKTPVPVFGVEPALFYKLLFTYLGVSIWLTWAATILALVSTTGIFPDFIAGGSVDLYLSKPIGRLWLFLTKYLGGLLFATLQVSSFAFFSFLLLGIRGHEWNPRIFLSIPLVVAVFSFLFCFCVLIGVLTRSAIAALLLTMLIWLGLWGAQLGESVLLSFEVRHELQIETLQNKIAGRGHRTVSWANMLPFGIGRPSKAELQHRLDVLKAEHGLQIWHSISFAIVTVVPKTQVATDLLKQILIDDASKRPVENLGPAPDFPDDQSLGRQTEEQQEYQKERTQKIQDGRGLWWSLGTSLAAEFAVVGIAALVFCRRDY